MSQSTKIILGIVVLALIAGAGLYWYRSAHPSMEEQKEAAAGTSEPADKLTTGTDNSNAALAKDSAQIDAQLQGVSSDNASAAQAVAASAQ